MKVAVYLTGLIIEKQQVLPHIKKMFDYLADRNNLSIDFYCHFWDPKKRYPYEIIDNDLKIVVPRELDESINYALEIFKPIDYKISPYNDMYDYFLQWFFSIHNKNDDFINEVKCSINNNLFLEKTIDKKFFVNNFPHDPEVKFNQWWFIHTKWCTFTHRAAQYFSASNASRLIVKQKKIMMQW